MVKSTSRHRTTGNGYIETMPVPVVMDILDQAADIDEARDMLSAKAKPTLVTLEEAQEQTGVKYGTLSHWLFKRRLRRRGRINYPAPGGGKILVALEDVEELARNRPKIGRPRRNGRKSH